MQLSKALLFSAVLFCLVQTSLASIYSQLQFMKIIEPTNGQDVRPGEKLTIKYVMQPLVKGENKRMWFHFAVSGGVNSICAFIKMERRWAKP